MFEFFIKKLNIYFLVNYLLVITLLNKSPSELSRSASSTANSRAAEKIAEEAITEGRKPRKSTTAQNARNKTKLKF